MFQYIQYIRTMWSDRSIIVEPHKSSFVVVIIIIIISSSSSSSVCEEVNTKQVVSAQLRYGHCHKLSAGEYITDPSTECFRCSHEVVYLE